MSIAKSRAILISYRFTAIQADARARYSDVNTVLDLASTVGIHPIAFLVEQRKDILR